MKKKIHQDEEEREEREEQGRGKVWVRGQEAQVNGYKELDVRAKRETAITLFSDLMKGLFKTSANAMKLKANLGCSNVFPFYMSATFTFKKFGNILANSSKKATISSITMPMSMVMSLLMSLLMSMPTLTSFQRLTQ